ncbi:DAP2 Dipeptidyl aminopeptidases/acylaminoacyl-peptidases [Fimbriimonadaceae bacterium]
MTLALALLSVASQASPAVVPDINRALGIEREYRGKAFRTRVTPNWLPNGGLWYRIDTGPDAFEWVAVDPAGKVSRFKTELELRKKLGATMGPEKPLLLTAQPQPRAAGERVDFEFLNRAGKPVQIFWVNDDERVPYAKIDSAKSHVQGTFSGHVWEVRFDDGKTIGYVTVPALGGKVQIEAAVRPEPTAPRPERQQAPWNLTIRKNDLWATETATGQEFQITFDGTPTDHYRTTGNFWSPDQSKLVVFRTRSAQERKVNIVSSSPKDQLQPKLITLDYLKPGDQIALPRPVLIDVKTRTAKLLDNTLFSNPWSHPPLANSGWGNAVTWSPDSKRFYFAYNQRGHQLMRVLSVDAETGTPTTLFEDQTKTFIHYSGKFWSKYLPKSNEIIWMSERDGWNHLYAHDATTGALTRQLTRGPWVVRSVESHDETANTLLLRVAGRTPKEDPYHDHYVELNLATGAILPLTAADGTHRLTFSPDNKTYLDTYSRVDLPPVTELRRKSDGTKIATLETSDITGLFATGWRAPQRFVAKGRDGKTDIYGVLWRPKNFKPGKKYPVIEQIYAGPQGFFVPKQWSPTFGNPQQIAELGFLVVQIDGMGTDGRSKAFHDVAFKNLKDAGFPDRIAWMKALAKQEPAMDLTRVGIYGGSAGGQNAMAAVLWHGDFYKAAVADCGCHDNRMDKVWWNEQWMGYPVDKSYEDSSNVVNAARLKGKLMLTVGELDTNVDPASTMQVADALIRAGKDFDLIVFPGGGHGAGESPYGKKKRMEFFIRHLNP